MARIRSIHPQACTSEKLAGVSAEAERCYWRLQTHCDDEGRAEDHPRLIWAALFPLHEDVTPERVDGWLDELHEARLVNRYEVDGGRYLSVDQWERFQHPQKKKESIYPARSGNGTRPVRDESVTALVVVEPGEGEGEGEGIGVGGGDVELSATPTDPVSVIFCAWQEHTNHPRAVLSPDRRKVVKSALKNYPVEDLVDACRGVHLSPHHRGENDRHTVYDDLSLVLRDSKNIEFFRDLARGDGGPKTPRMPVGTDMTQRNLARILEEA